MLLGWGTCAGPCEAVLLPRTAPTSRPCCRVRCRALSVLHILADPATRPVGSLKAGRARTAPPQSPALHPAGRCSPPTRSSRNSSPAPGSAGTTSACAPHDSGRFPSFCAFVFLLTSAGVALWAGMRRSPAGEAAGWEQLCLPGKEGEIAERAAPCSQHNAVPLLCLLFFCFR